MPDNPRTVDQDPLTAANPQKPAFRGTLCHPIESQNLFGDAKEIFIRHGDEMYRLTITRNGKLILQK